MTDEPDIATLSFERSIEVYKRGAALKAHCEAKLRAAQLQVEQIILGPAGPVGVEPATYS
jgi:exodeoxyribonuclease VII small subunit